MSQESTELKRMLAEAEARERAMSIEMIRLAEIIAEQADFIVAVATSRAKSSRELALKIKNGSKILTKIVGPDL